mgnify:CR=1 FL=1
MFTISFNCHRIRSSPAIKEASALRRLPLRLEEAISVEIVTSCVDHDVQEWPQGDVWVQLLVNYTSGCEASRNIASAAHCHRVPKDSKHLERFGNQLTAEELPVLLYFNLFILQFRSTFGMKEQLTWVKAILVTHRVPPKLVEIRQSLRGHLVY